MKLNTPEAVRRTNRRALIAAIVAAALCFAVFLINDLYGFRCWLVREKSQTE